MVDALSLIPPTKTVTHILQTTIFPSILCVPWYLLLTPGPDKDTLAVTAKRLFT